jgi:putative oxidoreductase
MNRILETNSQLTGLIARLTIALVLFPHGAQKLLGWWDGHGFTATMHYFNETVNLPYPVGVLVILIEFFCPILLVLGIGTRISSFLVFVVMAGVVITVQHRYFFMNWFGNQKGEGAEFFLLMIGLSLVSLYEGGGIFSIDKLIEGRKVTATGAAYGSS